MTAERTWRPGSPLQGVIGTARAGHLRARGLAVLDSRSLVRTLFLASAVQIGLFSTLRRELGLDELVEALDCRRPDRLRAWLAVGVDLGELQRRGDRYRVRGPRGHALADGDELLEAHYRSMLEYQVGPYAEFRELFGDDPGRGRDDLDRFADDIARVSLAAAPFVTSMIRRTVAEVRPARVLDVGCGSGSYSKTVLESDPDVEVDGVDLSEGVVLAARRAMTDAGLSSRVRLHVGDIRAWLGTSQDRFELVMLLNNIYYFEATRRPEFYRALGGHIAAGGELLVVSMTTPGSIASAHLHFMLSCQDGTASLPGRADLVADLAAAGYEVVEERTLVPGEPFVGVRARRVG